MNKQELIEKIEGEKFIKNSSDFEMGYNLASNTILEYIKQLDEPQKVKVPQFVAEFITEQKKWLSKLSESIDISMSDRVAEWYWDNSETFARAWLDGYEVEEEKRYFVKIKNVYHGDLGHAAPFEQFSFYTKERNHSGIRYEFTRKELEEAGFGWVFDCPGIEIEEVE